MAQDTRWVKLILPLPVESRCLLRMRRFSSRVRTGIVRSEVAVGTARLASMFSTMRRAPPRMGWAMSPGRMGAMARALGRRATAVLGGAGGWPGTPPRALGGATPGRARAPARPGPPVTRSKYSLQLASTARGPAGTPPAGRGRRRSCPRSRSRAHSARDRSPQSPWRFESIIRSRGGSPDGPRHRRVVGHRPRVRRAPGRARLPRVRGQSKASRRRPPRPARSLAADGRAGRGRRGAGRARNGGGRGTPRRGRLLRGLLGLRQRRGAGDREGPRADRDEPRGHAHRAARHPSPSAGHARKGGGGGFPGRSRPHPLPGPLLGHQGRARRPDPRPAHGGGSLRGRGLASWSPGTSARRSTTTWTGGPRTLAPAPPMPNAWRAASAWSASPCRRPRDRRSWPRSSTAP